ncbi:YegP family protein [Arenimonas caeni]|jgi:uncharacterized protein YegP (UPF0339 family)|uniref:YegP family protein n=1 Tax=Arenimonas caeni TaxID=2058085 RepID=UPI002A35AB33|nr:YegP family protein [Arenimonas caeni]MDY0021602.1 YegP family protein [Arenimonas caeni]
MAGKFEVSTRSNGEFQFTLKAGNGQVILASQGYAGRDGCMNGIESVRKNSTSEANFERLDAKDGRKYFTLKAGNGQVVGQSQMYADAGGRDNGIRSVMENAPSAAVEDAAG